MFVVQQVLYVVDLFCCPKHAAFSWIAGLISSLTMRQLIDQIIPAAATLSGCWSGRPYDLTYWYTYVEVSSLGVKLLSWQSPHADTASWWGKGSIGLWKLPRQQI